jgi:hypothetical protein
VFLPGNNKGNCEFKENIFEVRYSVLPNPFVLQALYDWNRQSFPRLPGASNKYADMWVVSKIIFLRVIIAVPYYIILNKNMFLFH